MNSEAAAKTIMCSTTPRKRSPRAIGEVYVSSASTVYLNLPIVHQTDDVVVVDPIYENAPPVPQRNRRTPQHPVVVMASSASRHRTVSLSSSAFSRCRISLPSVVGSDEISDGKPNVEQCITSFIGEKGRELKCVTIF